MCNHCYNIHYFRCNSGNTGSKPVWECKCGSQQWQQEEAKEKDEIFHIQKDIKCHQEA